MEQNIWWLFFAMSAGIGLFLSLILFTKPDKFRSGTLSLAIVILIFSLTLIQYVLHWSASVRLFPHMTNLWMAFNYLYGPLLLYFFLPKKISPIQWRLIHFLPAVVLICCWLPFGILPANEKLAVLDQGSPFQTSFLPHKNILWLLSPYFMVGGQVLYAAYFLYRSHKDGSSDRRFRRLVAYLFAAFVVTNASYFILVQTPYFTLLWDYLISLAMTICIFRLGLLAFHSPSYFFLMKKRTGRQEKYTTSSLNNAQSKQLADRTRRLVETQESYLESDLRLPSLAEQLNTSPQHVSQAINEHFDCSFSQWINQYRIAYACQLLSKGASAKEAGYQSGFNNLSTFYQVFKQEKGMPPAAYRQVVLEG